MVKKCVDPASNICNPLLFITFAMRGSPPISPPTPKTNSTPRGMTLLEMSIVILVLISLISLIFIGTRAWKAGSDRARCIMNIHNVQKAVRGYANLYGFEPGSVTSDLTGQVIGFGRFIESTPKCPNHGEYSFGEDYGTDTIPPIGTLYMKCSLATSDHHEPDNYSGW